MKSIFLRRVLITLSISLALLFMSCDTSGSSSSESSSSTTKSVVDANSVKGNISGIVTSNINGVVLNGVTVTIASVDGSTTRTKTTNNGIYAFDDLVPGDYVLSYVKTGYQTVSTSVFISPDQYKSDDPLNEAAISADNLSALVDILTATDTTTTSTEFATTTTDGSSATADLVESFSIQGSLTGNYTFAVKMVDVPLAPLSSTITGNISISLTTADNYTNTSNSVAVESGVSVYAIATDVLSDSVAANATTGSYLTSESVLDLSINYEFVTVTDANGAFEITDLPANTEFTIYLAPFEQTIGGIKYYFNGLISTTHYASEETFTTVDNAPVNIGDMVVLPIDAEPTIIQHNIGYKSATNPLTVDPSLSTSAIVLTFSKSMDTELFSAYVSVDDGDAVIDYTLMSTWSDTNTVVTLVAIDTLEDDEDGYLPYDLYDDGLTSTSTLELFAYSADGFICDYTGLAESLVVFTEEGINYNTVNYYSAAGEEVDTVPFDGSIEILFNKTLDVIANQVIMLYAGSKEIAIPAAAVAISDNILTIDFADVDLEAGLSHSIYIMASSTDYRDTDLFIETFTPTDSIELISTNLYEENSNIYYDETALTIANSYFPTTGAIEFKFNTSIAALTTEVALYKSSEIASLSTITDLNKHDMIILGEATATVADDTITITPSADLEPNTKYSVAIRIKDANGYDLLNTKTTDFESENTDVVVMEASESKAISYYIVFMTEANVVPVDKDATDDLNHSVTNIALDGSTTDFPGNDDIIIEFSKNIEDIGTILYYFDGSEYTETTATITVPTGSNIMTINPAFELYPGFTFAIALDIEGSTADDTLILDEADYITFTVDATTAISPRATGQTVDMGTLIVEDNPVPYGTLAGYNCLDTSIELSWPSLDELLGQDIYTLYVQTTDNEWYTDVNFVQTEHTFIQSIMQTTHEKVFANNVNDVLTEEQLYNSREIQYFISAYTDKGFLAQTSIETIKDEISPIVTTYIEDTAVAATALAAGNGGEVEYTFTFNEPVKLTTAIVSKTFSEASNTITATVEYGNTVDYTELLVTITVPTGQNILATDRFTITFTDSSGNAYDSNFDGSSDAFTYIFQ